MHQATLKNLSPQDDSELGELQLDENKSLGRRVLAVIVGKCLRTAVAVKEINFQNEIYDHQKDAINN